MTNQLHFESIRLGGINYDGPIEVQVSKYIDAEGMALILVTRDEGYPEVLAKVTVNLSQMGMYPKPGCVFVKDYSEGEGMVAAFEAKGWMMKTGRQVTSGWVTIPEMQLIGELADMVYPERQQPPAEPTFTSSASRASFLGGQR